MTETEWEKEAQKQMLGKKIIGVRYMTEDEADQRGWWSRGLIIELEGGQTIVPSKDDEGNGPGALFTNDQQNPVLPVL